MPEANPDPSPTLNTRRITLSLGTVEVISWGVSFYLPAVIAGPAALSLGVTKIGVLGGFSWALLVAGLVAPRVGRRIDRTGGRQIVAASAIVLAAGLALIAAAPDLILWYIGWTVLGCGMSAGLYDAAFATIGRLLGADSAPAITGVTLVAGFASTIFWPLGVALLPALGWRGLLLFYAGLQLVVNLPLVLFFVPPAGAAPPAPAPSPSETETTVAAPHGRVKTLTCLSTFFTVRWLITSAIAVFVLSLLSGLGLARGQAVFVAALFGPSQVAGRLLDYGLSTRLGLLTRARIAAALMPAGILVLALHGPAIAFAICYGLSNGVLTINRGTLPMAIFGPQGYATLLGWLAMPVLLAQAVAPTLAAPLVAAIRPIDVFILAGILGGAAALLLIPLRLRPGLSKPAGRESPRRA
ncbi:MAG: MFS transporter [Acetobacteraceae bacterium]